MEAPTTMREARALADELLEHGASVSTVVERSGLSESTVRRMRRRRGRMKSAEVLRLEAEVAELRARLQAEKARHDGTYQRERRKDQQLRDLRKKSPWQHRALRLGYGVFDLLPESVWVALLAGEDVPVRFVHRDVDPAERDTVIVLPEECAEDLRLVIALREGVEDTDGSDDPDAMRERFSRNWRNAIYGDDDE